MRLSKTFCVLSWLLVDGFEVPMHQSPHSFLFVQSHILAYGFRLAQGACLRQDICCLTRGPWKTFVGIVVSVIHG